VFFRHGHPFAAAIAQSFQVLDGGFDQFSVRIGHAGVGCLRAERPKAKV